MPHLPVRGQAARPQPLAARRRRTTEGGPRGQRRPRRRPPMSLNERVEGGQDWGYQWRRGPLPATGNELRLLTSPSAAAAVANVCHLLHSGVAHRLRLQASLQCSPQAAPLRAAVIIRRGHCGKDMPLALPRSFSALRHSPHKSVACVRVIQVKRGGIRVIRIPPQEEGGRAGGPEGKREKKRQRISAWFTWEQQG